MGTARSAIPLRIPAATSSAASLTRRDSHSARRWNRPKSARTKAGCPDVASAIRQPANVRKPAAANCLKKLACHNVQDRLPKMNAPAKGVPGMARQAAIMKPALVKNWAAARPVRPALPYARRARRKIALLPGRKMRSVITELGNAVQMSL